MNMQRALSFDDVALVPWYTGLVSRSKVHTITRLGPYEFQAPIISANMDTITGVQMARQMHELGGLGILHRFCSIQENLGMYHAASKDGYTVGVSVGVSEKEKERVEALLQANASLICVDAAHAHSKQAYNMVKFVKELSPNAFVIAGNICTEAGADYLSSAGADAVKVGVGPGGLCETRVKTGYGVPQLTAIIDCQRVKVPIIADGGIRKGADFVKALAAGASMVMLGSMLAGTNETPGSILMSPELGAHKIVRGMASREAQEDFMGHMPDWKTSEGVSVKVPAKGQVKYIINDLMGGLRSGLTYCGANNLEELKRKAKWVEVTHHGYIEGTAHKA